MNPEKTPRPEHWSALDHAIADKIEKGVPMETIRAGLKLAVKQATAQIVAERNDTHD